MRIIGLMLRAWTGNRPSANDGTIQLPSSETQQHQQIEDKFKGQRTQIGYPNLTKSTALK